MSIKSLDLLPEIFRTETNRKFLSATVDQLISESNNIRVESYVGRRDAATYQAGDTYVNEPTLLRQNYQLEPSVVVGDTSGQVDFYSSYQDTLQQIAYNGGITGNHSRMFRNQSYNFDGVFDFDKFINFTQYVWLPNGPPEIPVSATSQVSIDDYTVSRDIATESYRFTAFGQERNPVLTLVKGNTYKFQVNQPGHPFWIQTSLGVTGSASTEAEILRRSVFGVSNNGADVGTVTFTVPTSDAQDASTRAVLAATVDYATALSYHEIQSHITTMIPGGIDGVKSGLNNKTLVFINRNQDNDSWTDPGNFDSDLFDQGALPNPDDLGNYYSDSPFEAGGLVPGEQRFGVFRIRTVDVGQGRLMIKLEPFATVPVGQKVFVRAGSKNANVEFLRNLEGFFEPLIPVTAPLDELFYQDDSESLLSGSFRLIDPLTSSINVDNEIIGKLNYTSPNGVSFSNGMVIRFDSTVSPSIYVNNSYIVEGVGRGIRLISVGDFLVAESYASAGLATPDYITINRGSRDLNAWSRSNRWFHIQIVELSARYREEPTLLELAGAIRATRPIIEFDADLYLAEYGYNAKSPVDLLDFIVTDAFSQVEGKESYLVLLPNGQSRALTPGTRIIFASDLDPEVRNRIYKVEYITTEQGNYIHLVSQNTQSLPLYEVSGALITNNLSYNFLPTVSFADPIASIDVSTATGEVILSPTGVDLFTLSYSGIGYVADPYIDVKTSFDVQASTEVVYRRFKQLDYVRITDNGTGYTSTTPGILVATPNATEGVVTSNILGDQVFELAEGISPAEWLNISAGMQVIGRGVIGGTVVTSVDRVAQLVTLSAPVQVSASSAPLKLINSNLALVFDSVESRGLGYSSGTLQVSIAYPTLSGGSPATVGRVYLYANGAIQAVGMTSAGSGYLAAPTIVFTGANTAVATANTILNASSATASTGVPYVALGDRFIFKSNVTANTFAITTQAVTANALISVENTVMIDEGMIVSGGLQPVAISNVVTTLIPTRIVTSVAHDFQDGDLLLIRGVTGTTELNNSRYYVGRVGNTGLDLYADAALTQPIDATDFTSYISGGSVTGFTIDYGQVVVKSVISDTQFLTDQPVTIKSGTNLVFGGRTATALARSDSNGIYSVTVTDPGSGYTSVPAITIDAPSGSGNQAAATAVMSYGSIDYIKVTDAGEGYTFQPSDISVDIISDITIVTAETAAYTDSTLTFATEEEVMPVQVGWLAFLITNKNSQETLCDFARTPYATDDTTGPNTADYHFYMDAALTSATVLTVQSKSANTITLSGPMNSRDSDGEFADLPAGSKIYFTAQNIFFTEDGYGSSQVVTGTRKSTFITSLTTNASNVVGLESVMGVHPGMLMQDLSGGLPDDTRVVSVDPYLRQVTISKDVTIAAGIPIYLETNAATGVKLVPAAIETISIVDPGKNYTNAPVMSIEPLVPVVTKLASCLGDKILIVDNYDGIELGSVVTSQYNNDGQGLTTGSAVPTVVRLYRTQIGSATYQYNIELDQVQSAFDGILVTFTKSARGVATIVNTNSAYVVGDTTPETYEAGDTVLLTQPNNPAQLSFIATYNQFYFNGANWVPAQQKDRTNQAPLFDVFDTLGYSAGDSTKYSASKFVGTKIFGYSIGSGNNDTVLGFPLKYRNFQNVGDIEFTNHFQTDTFNYLSGFGENTLPINSFVLRKSLPGGTFFKKNVWSALDYVTKQFQIIEHVFDGKTNYFEVDILPEPSRIEPNQKVYVENELITEDQYRFEQVGGRQAVVIDAALLTVGNRVKISIYSRDVSDMGYYEIPVNASNNPLNENFSSLTLGQIRNHLVTMCSNRYGVVGSALGSNNLRDLDVKTWQGSILQHASPVPLGSLFLSHPQLNILKSLTFAQREYTKFKNRFLDAAGKIEIDVKDIPSSVDRLMVYVMAGRSTTSPWYQSDMVPYLQDLRTTTDLPVLNISQKTYLIPSTFDPTNLSLRSVLIYLRDSTTLQNQQLVLEKDFVFNTATSTITIKDHVQLAYTQRISIVDYTDTSGCYVPETPTKLGMWPKYVPMRYLDDTYRSPTEVIQGHDGSITPVFDDYRDDLLLELELRIYNNIKSNFDRNQLSPGASLVDFLPGKFRDVQISRTEFDLLLTSTFLAWVGTNQLDYSSNADFSSSDAFSWNYGQFQDQSGEQLPGYWRGIYRHYYDTDRPHIAPWEMLGFAREPLWWKEIYGTAPYTSGNQLLWDHLEQGLIYSGDRAGIDLRYARPGLGEIIPVDENGSLKPPLSMMVARYNSVSTSAPFAVGDQGPVESAWRRSSEYAFAVNIAAALSVPSWYCSNLFDTSRYVYDNDLDQFILSGTQSRITPATLTIPKSGVSAADAVLTSGYSNWIRDYLSYIGVDGSALMADYLSRLDVNLSYKVAGFTDKKMLQVVANQSSPGGTGNNIIIPDDNYEVYLHKGSPLRRAIYSAVIVEKTNTGFKLSGYDTIRPYFTIVPSENNSNAYSITVLNASATIYRDYQLRRVTIPYGFEVSTTQGVVDFLVSYQRSLLIDGFVFNDYDDTLQQKKDWVLSAQELLTWVQQGWKAGSLLVLSPVGSKLTLVTESGVVDEITNQSLGSKLLDQNFNLIRQDTFHTSRIDNTCTITGLLGQTISLADLDVVEYEHVLVFDNVTEFGDIIYVPSLGSRQGRLKLVGYKSGGWNGQLHIPGYVYNNKVVDEWISQTTYRLGSLVQYKDRYYVANSTVPASTDFDFNYWRPISKESIKTGLLPNFSVNAEKFRNIYDVDNHPSDEQLADYSAGLIGFRPRSYLTDLNLDNTSQLKFYQGYIRQKGTKNAITSLITGSFDNVESDIAFYEEWALRVGEYGAAGGNQYIEIIADESQFTDNPTSVGLVNFGDSSVPGVINFDSTTIYRSSEPVYNKDIIPYRNDAGARLGDNISAGYPRLDDVDGTIYDISKYQDYSSLVSDIGAGYLLWTAIDFNKSWNVYRATETDVQIVQLSLLNNSRLTFTFDNNHLCSAGELIVIKNFVNKSYDGFYRVISVNDSLNLTVQGYRNLSQLTQSRTAAGTGVFLRMVSVRYSSVRNILGFTPPHGWRNDDRAWVDNDTDTGIWGVYKKSSGWDFNQLVPLREGDDRTEEGYGREIRINVDNQIIMAGTPDFTQGSLQGATVILPGSGYQDPVVEVSPPTGFTIDARTARLSAVLTNGQLINGEITVAGQGYTVSPNVTITDTTTVTTTAETLNTLEVEISAAEIEHVYIGDSVTIGISQLEDYQYSVIGINTAGNLFTIQSDSQISFISVTAITMEDIVTPATQIFNADTSVLSLAPGLTVRAYMRNSPGNYFDGTVQTFDSQYSGQITIDITVKVGSGTSSSWLLVIEPYIPLGTAITLTRGAAGVVEPTLVPTYVESVQIIDGGSGFVATPKLLLIGGGTTDPAEISAVITNGSITAITVINPGSGYTSMPVLSVQTSNTVAIDLQVKMAPTGLSGLTITSAGDGYREPQVVITPSTRDGGYGGTIAIAGFTPSGGISSIIVTNRGHSYNSSASIQLSSIGGGLGFAGTVNVYANGRVQSVTVGSSGSGYNTSGASVTTASLICTSGTGAVGAIDRTDNGIGSFIVDDAGAGYIVAPTITIAEAGGGLSGGTGATAIPIFPTGQVKTFLRPSQTSDKLEQTQTIKPYSDLAREFGYSVDIRQKLGAIGSPGSNNETGAVLLAQCLGSLWISSQLLFPSGLSAGDRFGHSISISNDDQWIYVGAPGANKVFCYGKKMQTFPRETIVPNLGILSYTTNFTGLQTAYEVKILGTDGRYYEPEFDYTVNSSGTIFFADYSRIALQPLLYVSRQRLSTTIVPVTRNQILQKVYELRSTPQSIEQILVYGASGRVLIPNLEYIVIGASIVFVGDSFNSEPSLTVTQKEEFYELVDTLEPTDTINSDANFGWSIKTDSAGLRIIVGAPDADADDGTAGAGRAYVFNRSSELITTNGKTKVFTVGTLRNVVYVTLDAEPLSEFSDYTVENNTVLLTNFPRNGAKLRIDTNYFNIIQVIPCVEVVNQGQFGYTVDVSSDNSVLAIGSPGYRNDNYYNGAVYRFVNKGLAYGTIVSTAPYTDVTVSLGDTIKINSQSVTFQNIGTVIPRTIDNIDLLKKNIDSAQLTAITTTITDDYHLKLSIASGTALQQLDLLPGEGTALAGIGFEIYGLTQTILHPRYGVPEKFGLKVRLDEEGTTLLISSKGANTLKTSTFDNTYLVFDKDTTRFVDSLNASGAVYVYDYLSPPGETLAVPGKMLYNQVLQNPYILTGDNFGAGIDINNGWALVGADTSSHYYNTINGNYRSGLVHLFTNVTKVKGWSRLYQRNQLVDISYVDSIKLYNRSTQKLVEQVDYYDPVKGKILGIADQDLDYKTLYDPASYNQANVSVRVGATLSTDSYWNDLQVGKVWWDLNLCKYIQYEQGELIYRNKYWGELFPGSQIVLAEWVQSIYLPSQYATLDGDGEAKYPDDTAYVIESYFDDINNTVKTRYYYWVINKRGVDTIRTGRTNSIVSLQSIIESPISQDIPYLAVTSSSSFSLYNANKLLKSTDVVLRIEYSRVLNNGISHSEYELIQQGNPLSSIPDKLISKMVDSLSGENSTGQIVPDLNLKAADAYGIGLLPRQSMIVDPLAAAKVFVTFVNLRLAAKPVVSLRNLEKFFLADPIPPAGVGFYNLAVDTVDQLSYIPPSDLSVGYLVLVRSDANFSNYWAIYTYTGAANGFQMSRIQSYDTTRWWNYVDYYQTGYSKYTPITHTINRYADAVKLRLQPGQTIKVLNDASGYFAVYVVNTDLSLTEVAREKGTIQLSSALYDPKLSYQGFDNAAFDQVGFGNTQSAELRNIFEGLISDIFIDEDSVYVNDLFFTMVNYILSEQVSIDWAMKTSLISVVHKIRKLLPFANYIRDNQDYYSSYINEVKPYRTQVREYLLDYQGIDTATAGMTDFDLFGVYDQSLSKYRTLNTADARDLSVIRNSARNAWLKNYTYSVQSLLLQDGGNGYTQAPTVTITGGRTGGKAATARAVLGPLVNGAGPIVDVILTSSGSGYTSNPVIEFVGGNGTGAKATVVLQDSSGNVGISTLNRTIRNLMTTVKFDRVSYNSAIRNWKPYEHYSPGEIITVPEVRLATFAGYTERQLPRYVSAYRIVKTLLGRASIDLNVFLDPTIVERLSGADLANANDRLAAYNQPGSPDSARLYTTTDIVRFVPSPVNDQISSVANQWNAISHSLVVPDAHRYQYAAVGDRNLLALSIDGLNWEAGTLTSAGTQGINLRDVVFFGANTWVAVGNQGTLITNSNGVDWLPEKIESYRFDPVSENPGGLTQYAVSQTLDISGAARVTTTFGDYLVVVGNNGLILANARGNSVLQADWNEWLRIRVQNLVEIQDYLKVFSVDLGYLQDSDGTQYNVAISTVSGYYTESTSGIYSKAKLGYLFTVGLNGAINMISYMNLDDVITGYIGNYNYTNGKNGDLGYPWIRMTVPTDVRGIADGYSGEQINSLAVSGLPSGQDRWIVAVGSTGTLLWNRFDTTIRVRLGRAELASDTIGKTVVDHETHAFDNFRPFDDSNFVAPLTKEVLANININDINWDGEKFVAVANKGLILWGYPGTQANAYIEITNIEGATAVTTKRPAASWSSANDATTVTVTIPSIAIVGGLIVEGMTCYGAGLPAGAVVDTVTYSEPDWNVVLKFPISDVVAATNVNVTFAYVLTSDDYVLTDTIPAGTYITATNGTNTTSLHVSQDADRGSTRIYIDNFTETLVQANWSLSGTGIPAGARVRWIGKFPDFRWQQSKGNQLSNTLDYRAMAVNSTTFTITSSDTGWDGLIASSDTGRTKPIVAGDLVTLFDPTGTRVQVTATEHQEVGSILITISTAELRTIAAGYTMEANSIQGLSSNAAITVKSTENYVFGGVVSRLEKDIPAGVPGTDYTGAKVTGQGFTDTNTDTLNLDTEISSKFLDDQLGLRPEDIIVDGGKFIDTYSSHAPEELVPGQVIDSLQMNVFTAATFEGNGQPNFGNVIAYKIFTDYRQSTSYYRLTAANTTVLSAALTYQANTIAVSDIAKLPDPNPDLNILGSIWLNGERITYLGIDRVNGLLTNIRRGANRTSIPLEHPAGSVVSDATTEQFIEEDRATAITENVVVNNGLGDSATYLSTVTPSIPQTNIWQDLL